MTRMLSADLIWLDLAAALGIGLLIGAERERHKGGAPARSPAGIRTFAIVSLLGAVCMLLGGEVLVAAALLGTAALFGVAYWRSIGDDPGLTTETAVLLTLVLGALATRSPGLAAGLAVAVAVLLTSRDALHRFVRSVLTESELDDLLVLAAATLVVLPLIPDRYVGPFDAINPRTIWIIVILVMAIGAAGHVALRTLGARLGLPLIGLASGFISSIATIAAMGGRATREPALLGPAVAGAVLSTVATIVLVAILLAATSPSTLKALALPLAFAGVAAAGSGAFYTRSALRDAQPAASEAGRAFSIPTALLLAALIAVVLVAAAACNAWFGTAGLTVAAAIAGFADTHSTAVSIASLVVAQRLDADAAAVPILLALTTNTVSKAVVAATSGGRPYALRVVPGLILVVGAAWAGWLLR
jgi:uncharacterized membrane protein (DUF4010 family)